jgi:hypothetical protein
VDEPKNLDGADSPENLAGIKVAGRARRRELFTVQLAGIQLSFPLCIHGFLVHGEFDPGFVVLCAWPVKAWFWFDSMRCFLEHRLEFHCRWTTGTGDESEVGVHR